MSSIKSVNLWPKYELVCSNAGLQVDLERLHRGGTAEVVITEIIRAFSLIWGLDHKTYATCVHDEGTKS